MKNVNYRINLKLVKTELKVLIKLKRHNLLQLDIRLK